MFGMWSTESGWEMPKKCKGGKCQRSIPDGLDELCRPCERKLIARQRTRARIAAAGATDRPILSSSMRGLVDGFEMLANDPVERGETERDVSVYSQESGLWRDGYIISGSAGQNGRPGKL